MCFFERGRGSRGAAHEAMDEVLSSPWGLSSVPQDGALSKAVILSSPTHSSSRLSPTLQAVGHLRSLHASSV